MVLLPVLKDRAMELIWLVFLFGAAWAQTKDYVPIGYEVVTEEESGGLSALDKCGEGPTKGVNICVPYHMCDGRTNTVIQDGRTDGFGVIDIRFGANECKHPLDVCCKIPPDGPPPTPGTTEPPIPTPPSPPLKQSHCGIRNINGIDFKITGNKDNEAEYGEFPWTLAILKKNYNPAVDAVLAICGGSLITPKVALTGAHCVYKYKTSEIRVRAGEWDTQTEKERLPYQERDVSEIIVHEEFKEQTLYNNVALLILTSSFKQADNVATICLPPQGQLIHSKNCFANGWGKDVFGQEGQYQVILKKIELPIVEHAQCQQELKNTRLGKHFLLHDSFICAGGEEGKDTCTGDGGSPLICPDPNQPNRYVQAGIVSWGIGCGQSIPGVYADVGKFRNWIDQKLERLNIGSKPYTD